MESYSDSETGWKVILRGHDDRRVVLYHAENKQLVVKPKWGRSDASSGGSVPGLDGRGGEADGVGDGEAEKDGGVYSAVNGLPSPTPMVYEDERISRLCPFCGGSSGGGGGGRGGRSLGSRVDGRNGVGFRSYPRQVYIASDYFRLLEKSAQNAPAPSEEDYGLGSGALNEGYYARFFVEEQRVGSGAKGSVFLCRHVMDGVYLGMYAVKKIPVGDNHAWLVNMLREVRILENLHHPNIIEYKHTWLEKARLSEFAVEVPCLFVLTEFANGGNLLQYMQEKDGESEGDGPDGEQNEKRTYSASHREKRRRIMRHLKEMNEGSKGSQAQTNNAAGTRLRILPESIVWRFFLDMLSGLDHLHRHGIVHRDLKPQNLLLHMEESDTIPRILLSDFGECEYLSRLDDRPRTGYTGTMEFVAPELMETDSTGRYCNIYDKRCDIWSLGMVLYQMTTGQLPWRAPASDPNALCDEILHAGSTRPLFPPPCESRQRPILRSSELTSLVESILIREPERRPTTRDLFDAVSAYMSTNNRMSTPERGSPTTSPPPQDHHYHHHHHHHHHHPRPTHEFCEPVALLLDTDQEVPVDFDLSNGKKSTHHHHHHRVTVPSPVRKGHDHLLPLGASSIAQTIPLMTARVADFLHRETVGVATAVLSVGKLQAILGLCAPYRSSNLMVLPIAVIDLVAISLRLSYAACALLVVVQMVWLSLLVLTDATCELPLYSGSSSAGANVAPWMSSVAAAFSLACAFHVTCWAIQRSRRKRPR